MPSASLFLLTLYSLLELDKILKKDRGEVFGFKKEVKRDED